MMRKTLWALALLLVLSGCSDGGEDTPPRQDDLVNTTFNIEYSLNLDTPSVNYPSSYNQQSPAPSSGIPAIPRGWRMRFVAELWEELLVNEADPSAGTYYKRYNTKTWIVSEHTPVSTGEADRYITSIDGRIAKGKFKMLIWADYISNRSIYFGVSLVNDLDNNIRGLRYVSITSARQRENYDAFSGTTDIDFTVYEGMNTASATVDATIERVFGKFTLIATDLQEYKDRFSEEEYENFRRPLYVKVDYGAEYAPSATDEETGELINGMRGNYDALNQTASYFKANQEMQFPYISVSEDGNEMVLTFDYAAATADNTPLKDVKLTIFGPMNLTIAKLNISSIPLVRNKETFFRAPFFTNAWVSGEPGEGGITITDDFGGNGEPEEI